MLTCDCVLLLLVTFPRMFSTIVWIIIYHTVFGKFGTLFIFYKDNQDERNDYPKYLDRLEQTV